jgi:hypothetical protein
MNDRIQEGRGSVTDNWTEKEKGSKPNRKSGREPEE